MALRARGYNNCCNPEHTGEAKFVRFLGRLEPKLCIDIGANRGHYSEALLKFTQARIIAFEPLPKTFAVLSRIAISSGGRMSAVNVGVGDRCTELELHFGEHTELASFSKEVLDIGYVGACNTESIRVPVVTLDSYFSGENRHLLENGIDLIKIDTEGFEYEVLRGAIGLIELHRPSFIQIEFNRHQLFRGHPLHSFSRMLPGYDVYQLLPYGSGMIRVVPDDPLANLFEYSNFVFALRDRVGHLLE